MVIGVHVEKPREYQRIAWRAIEPLIESSASEWDADEETLLPWLDRLAQSLEAAEAGFLSEWNLHRTETDHCFALSIGGVVITARGEAIVFRRGSFRAMRGSSILLLEETVQHEVSGKEIVERFGIDVANGRVLSSAVRWFPAARFSDKDIAVLHEPTDDVRVFHSQLFAPAVDETTIEIVATAGQTPRR